jgi:hypothetical protein
MLGTRSGALGAGGGWGFSFFFFFFLFYLFRQIKDNSTIKMFLVHYIEVC